MLIFICVLLAVSVVTNLLLVMHVKSVSLSKSRMKTYAEGLEASLLQHDASYIELQKKLEATQAELAGTHRVIESIVHKVPAEVYKTTVEPTVPVEEEHGTFEIDIPGSTTEKDT